MDVIDKAKDMEKQYDNSGRVENAASLLDAYISDAVNYRNEVSEHAIFDQTYGPKDRNKMDIFWPGKDHDVPLAMFIHGGYWQRLDRSAFSHMAKGLNKRGVAVAIPSYTLCPNITIAGIIDEMRRACVILWKTYKRPITVFGHSAGGHLAACMLATKWNRIHSSLPEELVQSALSISGVYELAPLIQTSHNNALRLNEENAKHASPYYWLIEPGQRFDAWVGTEESGEFLRQARSQAQRWRMMGAATRCVEIPGANHFTAIHPLTDPRSRLIARLLEMMKKVEAPTLESLSFINQGVPKAKPEPEIAQTGKKHSAKDKKPQTEKAVQPPNQAKGQKAPTSPKNPADKKGETQIKNASTEMSGPKSGGVKQRAAATSKPTETEPTAEPSRTVDTARPAQPTKATNTSKKETAKELDKDQNINAVSKTASEKKDPPAIPDAKSDNLPSKAKPAPEKNKGKGTVDKQVSVQGEIKNPKEHEPIPPKKPAIEFQPLQLARRVTLQATTEQVKAPDKNAEPLETRTQPEPQKDDLAIISGIGDVLQARLHDLGFSTFEQIAKLDEDQKAMIEDVLDFKGRIDREHWITQARHQKAIKELTGKT